MPIAVHPKFPIQVRVAEHKGGGDFTEYRLWSHHKKNDGNARRAFKEAIRDYPDSLVVLHDTATGQDLDAYFDADRDRN